MRSRNICFVVKNRGKETQIEEEGEVEEEKGEELEERGDLVQVLFEMKLYLSITQTGHLSVLFERRLYDT